MKYLIQVALLIVLPLIIILVILRKLSVTLGIISSNVEYFCRKGETKISDTITGKKKKTDLKK